MRKSFPLLLSACLLVATTACSGNSANSAATLAKISADLNTAALVYGDISTALTAAGLASNPKVASDMAAVGSALAASKAALAAYTTASTSANGKGLSASITAISAAVSSLAGSLEQSGALSGQTGTKVQLFLGLASALITSLQAAGVGA